MCYSVQHKGWVSFIFHMGKDIVGGKYQVDPELLAKPLKSHQNVAWFAGERRWKWNSTKQNKNKIRQTKNNGFSFRSTPILSGSHSSY